LRLSYGLVIKLDINPRDEYQSTTPAGTNLAIL
jgi:hypothetical protein